MKENSKLTAELVKEAIRQADANMNFEDVKIDYQEKKNINNKTKVLRRNDKRGKRSLG